MFHYTNEKDMKNFLYKNVVCKTKEDKKMLEQIKHYLDWPLQLYALQEAEFSLQDELRGKFDNLILTIPKGIISSLADELYERDLLNNEEKCKNFVAKFLDETSLEENDSPFHPDNISYECAYSAHDPYPTFDIQFINADGNEDETEFTCESGQNIVHSLRELHDFYEDFRKDNPGIKKIIQVIYMGTDSHYIPNKGEE